MSLSPICVWNVLHVRMRGVDQTLGYIFPLFLVGVRLLTTLFPLPRSRLSLKPVIHLILIPSSFRFPLSLPLSHLQLWAWSILSMFWQSFLE